MTNLSESPKPSRLAVLSFVLGVIVWFLWCALYGGLGIMAETNQLTETAGYIGFFLGPVVLGIITLLLAGTGMVLGVQAIRKKDPKRGFAIAGLMLNFICLCPFVLFLIALLAAGASSIPDFINQIMPSFGP